MNPFSSTGKRAGESFVASENAKQKPVHGTAIIARRIYDNNADMNTHAVPPPDYKVGGDSKREELCQQDLQKFTIPASGAASSSERLEALGAASSFGRPGAVKDPSRMLMKGKFFLRRTLMENDTSGDSVAAPNPKRISIGVSQRVWKTNPSRAKHKGLNSEILPSTSRVFCDTEVVMTLTEHYVGHMLRHSWMMLSKLKLGTNK